MSGRPPATLADYLLVGINPSLIMLLIGSIVYYLVLMFYAGEHSLRLHFILAMFIMGAVAVGRISMEEGAGYATLFGVPLAIVSLVALNRFVEYSGPFGPFSILINSGLIALIWWLSYQLTWDCTLLDEQADTSDQGLLQATGLSVEYASKPGSSDDAKVAGTDSVIAADDPLAKWAKLLERNGKPHAHGMWIVYVAIAALPVFGFGQWLIARDSRSYAFTLLVVYIIAAMALLMNTSFLGLRRYLRNRRISMPLEITGVWLGVGSVLIGTTVLLCLLLPRPGNTLVAKLAFRASSPTHSTSTWGVGPAGKSAEPQPTPTLPRQTTIHSDTHPAKTSGSDGQSSPDKTSGARDTGTQQSPMQEGPAPSRGDSNSPNDQTNGKNSPQRNAEPNSQPSGDNSPWPTSATKMGEKQADQNTNGQAATGAARSSSQAKSANAVPLTAPNAAAPAASWGSLGNVARFVFFVTLTAAICYLAWRYRQHIHAAWQQLLKELRELWSHWFGQRRSAVAANAPSAVVAAPAAFDSFVDPFSSGQAAKISRVELVRYTFEALQAFGREQGCLRLASETPHEYAIRLSEVSKPLRTDALALAEYYAMAAYAKSLLPDAIAVPLRSLWTTMHALHMRKNAAGS